MASANIGSDKAKAQFDSTPEKKEQDFASSFTQMIEGATKDDEETQSLLHPLVRELVTYIFSEATSKLTATVSAKITDRGIETPLGVLTLVQVL